MLVAQLQAGQRPEPDQRLHAAARQRRCIGAADRARPDALRVPHRRRTVVLTPLEVVGAEYFLARPTCRCPACRCPSGRAAACACASSCPPASTFSSSQARHAALLPRRLPDVACGCTSCMVGALRRRARRRARPRRRGAARSFLAGRAGRGRSATTTTRRCCRSRCAASPAPADAGVLRLSRSASCSSTSPGSAPRFAQGRRHDFEIVFLFTRHVPRSKAGRAPTTSSCTACRRSTCSSGAPTASRSNEGDDAVPPRARPHARRWTSRSSTSLACTASERRQRASRLPAALRRASTASRRRNGLLQRRARAAPAVRRGEARGAALRLHRHRDLPVAGRSARGAVRARRCGSSRCTVRCTNRDLPLVHARRAGARRPRRSTPRAGRARSASSAGPSRPRARCARGHRLAAARPAVAQLPVAARQRAASRARVALREMLTLFAARCRRRHAAPDRGVRSVRVEPVVRRHPWPGRSPSAAASRSR